MKEFLKRYGGWIAAVVAGLIAIAVGTQTPDVRTVTQEIVRTVETRVNVDSVYAAARQAVPRTRARRDTIILPGTPFEDRSRINTLLAERQQRDDSLTALGARTNAWSDTMLTVSIVDSTEDTLGVIELYAYAIYVIETNMVQIGADVLRATVKMECDEPSAFWRWVERVLAAAIVILSKVL